MPRLLLTAGVVIILLSACQPAASTTPTASNPAPSVPAASASAAPSHTPEVERLLAAAREAGETQLDLSWSANSLGGYEAISRYEALFNRMYGTNIKVTLTAGPSVPDMQAKVIQEQAAGRRASSDILFGGDTNLAATLRHDLFEEYDYTLLSPRLTPDIVAYRNIGVEVYGTIPAILYNSDLVKPPDVPQRLGDVLDPKWKGKIAGNQTVGELSRVAMRPDWGRERMQQYVTRLSQQVGGLIRNSEEERIISGEFLMMVLSNTHGARFQQSKGAPIGYVIPLDGAAAGYQYLSVPRNSAHPNLAKLYVNMVVSEEGQRVLWETYGADHHRLPGSRTAPEIAELRTKGADVFDINVEVALQWPDLAQFRADLDRTMSTGSAR
jgi:iron(III) transport system substrate-binding protein